MLLMTIFNVVDLENSRELQNDIPYDYLSSYVGFPNRNIKEWKDRSYVIQGGIYGSGALATVVGAMSLSVGHWVVLILGIVVIVVIAIIVIVLNRKQVALEFYPYHRHVCSCKKSIQKLEKSVPDVEQQQVINEQNLQIQQEEQQEQQLPLVQRLNRQIHKDINNAMFVIEAIGLVVTIIIIAVFCCQPYGYDLHAYVPAYYVTMKSIGKVYYNKNKIEQAENEFLEQVEQLGHYQLSKSYPLVHGNEYQWCSWNYRQCQEKYGFNISETQSFVPTKLTNPPNLVNIYYESWTPSPTFIKSEFYNAETQDGWIDGQPYSEDTFPDLIQLSQNSINFLSLSTNALPTIHAWHSLVTSEKVSLSSYNAVKSVYHQIESQNSALKQKYNFHSTYMSPAPGDFDGKEYWFGRESLYDAVYYQAPTDDQIHDYNIPINPKNAWVDDKISTRQAMLAFSVDLITSGQSDINTMSELYCRYCGFTDGTNCTEIIQRHIQYLEQSEDNYIALPGQPLQLSMLTVNTHNPWKGYFKKSDNVYDYSIKDDYERQLKYSQEQITNLINFILEAAPNTIFTINGDHGARISAQERLGEQFDDRCKKKTTGNDEMYDVSGILGWGQNVSIPLISNLQQYVNKTYTKMFDFDDLMNLIYQMYEFNMPTSRNSYFTKEDIINGTWLQKCSNKLSTSATHTIIEVREKDKIFRSNLFSSDNGIYIEDLQYPTCVVTENKTSNIIDNKEASKEMYERGKRQIIEMNYGTSYSMTKAVGLILNKTQETFATYNDILV